MKKAILSVAFLASVIFDIKAQDACVIPMMVLVPQQVETLAPMAQMKLESRLRQIITMNGMEGSVAFSNFCVVANVIEGSKEVMSGLQSHPNLNFM